MTGYKYHGSFRRKTPLERRRQRFVHSWGGSVANDDGTVALERISLDVTRRTVTSEFTKNQMACHLMSPRGATATQEAGIRERGKASPDEG